MELHNMDEYLDLQEQNEINLLSAEGITPIENESEWHSVTPTTHDNTFLYGTENNNNNGDNNRNHDSNWGFVDLNLFVPNYIAPDSLTIPQRVTRSRNTITYKRKKSSTKKKLYCVCQQPYNGKPMVQCDHCEDWFHCACVNFDPDEQEDDMDWICDGCKELKQASQEIANEETGLMIQEPVLETRQSRNTSTCLYKPCNNRTRLDSYCSDVCARKDEKPKPRRTKRSIPKEEEQDDDDEYVHEEEEEEEKVLKEKKKSTKKAEKDNEKKVEKDNEKDSEKKSPELEPTQSEISEKNSPKSETLSKPEQDMTLMNPDENPVRRNVIKNMTGLLEQSMASALERDPDVFDKTPIEEKSKELARSIEATLFERLGENNQPGEPYKIKFRSLYHNLRDKANHNFQWRVVTGDLSPLELIGMSSEDMANPELKSKSEVLRQKSLKNSILKMENMPIIKKTHKGDIIMIPKDSGYQEQVDKVDPPLTETVLEPVKSITTAAAAEPMDDILARIGIQEERNMESHRVKKRKVTVDVEELLGEEEETPFEVEMDMEEEVKTLPMVVEQPKEKVASIWQGRVNMPQVAEFEACARQIGGRQMSPEEWSEVLSPTMWVEGRIPAERVTSYITQTQYSSSREIVLIQVEAENRQTELGLNNGQTEILLNYLETRKRFAVVGHNKTQIKDFYLIPLKKHQNIPDCLYVVRVEESERDCDLFLGVLVLQKKTYRPY
ncbi:hypothetical protein G6F56_006904 [Rhizopus delemar]|nr:hypothetical protein G6F56_006904 [Rhizopus delemar]